MEALEVIKRVIAEHHGIRDHIKLAGDTVTDFEALSTLQQAHSGWAQSTAGSLVEKRDRLQQAMSFLEKGLTNHFSYEEKYLPPLFGELLMKSLLLEHRDIASQIGNAKALISGARLEKLGQKELLAEKLRIENVIGNLSQTVEEHAGHEEIILNMLKKALEETGQ